MFAANELIALMERLENAGARVEEARSKRASAEQVQAWLGALTDYVRALAEVERESLQERLHGHEARVGMGKLSVGPR